MNQVRETYVYQNEEMKSPETKKPSTFSLLKSLVLQASRLADKELELVKVEGKEKLQETKRRAIGTVVSSMFILIGVMAFLTAITLYLSPDVPAWLSVVVIGALCCLGGFIGIRISTASHEAKEDDS